MTLIALGQDSPRASLPEQKNSSDLGINRARFDFPSGRGDHSHGPIRAPILERAVLDIQNATISRIDGRGGGSIGDRDHTPAGTKLTRRPEPDVAARRQDGGRLAVVAIGRGFGQQAYG